VFEQLDRFRQYHAEYANPAVPQSLHDEYIHMLVEQMLAHFEFEATAVQSFISHYVTLITDASVSPRFKFHPLKFVRQMENHNYEGYIYCLYGFADDMFKLFQRHRLFNNQGNLIAGYQHIAGDTLYLVVRPEVSDVFLY
jgi:hypothetical protein